MWHITITWIYIRKSETYSELLLLAVCRFWRLTYSRYSQEYQIFEIQKQCRVY